MDGDERKERKEERCFSKTTHLDSSERIRTTRLSPHPSPHQSLSLSLSRSISVSESTKSFRLLLSIISLIPAAEASREERKHFCDDQGGGQSRITIQRAKYQEQANHGEFPQKDCCWLRSWWLLLCLMMMMLMGDGTGRRRDGGGDGQVAAVAATASVDELLRPMRAPR